MVAVAKPKYDPSEFAASIQAAISHEIQRVAAKHGYSKSEAAVIVSHMAMGPVIGFTAAAMGKGRPTEDAVRVISRQFIDLIAEMP